LSCELVGFCSVIGEILFSLRNPELLSPVIGLVAARAIVRGNDDAAAVDNPCLLIHRDQDSPS